MNSIDQVIAGHVWTGTAIGTVFRDLCLKFSNRFSGGVGAHQSADYLCESLRGYGISSVRQESFPVISWQRGRCAFTMMSPESREYPSLSLPYSPSCSNVFKLIDLGMGHPIDIAKQPIEACAVLIDDRNPQTGPHLHRLQKYLNVLKAKAGAFIFIGGQPGTLPPTGSLAFDPTLPVDQAIPSIGIAYETGQELRYWLSKGPVTIRLEQENSLSRATDTNVIADIGGHIDHPRTTIVAAHYDGHDICHAANDNASGTAVAVETARVLSKLPPDRIGNVRIILFGGEEIGLMGSYAYARSHRDELKNIKFVFNLDCVGKSGRLGILVQQCTSLISRLQEWVRNHDIEIDVFDHIIPFSDHFPFFLNGVPCAFCATEGNGQRSWDHTAGDSFDKVSIDSLRRVAAQISQLTAHVSSDSDWPHEHLQSCDIESILSHCNVEELMRHERRWPF